MCRWVISKSRSAKGSFSKDGFRRAVTQSSVTRNGFSGLPCRSAGTHRLSCVFCVLLV